MKSLFIILVIISRIIIQGGESVEKTVVEGQGLFLHEDSNEICAVVFETPDQQPWSPLKVGVEPASECFCCVRLARIPREWDNHTVSLFPPGGKVEYRLNVIPFDELLTLNLTVINGDKIEAECVFPKDLDILHCRMHLQAKDKLFKWCHRRVYSGHNETIHCQATVRGSVDPVYSTVNIIHQNVARNSQSDRVFRFETKLGPVESCTAENMETKLILNLEDNLIGNKYSSQRTKLSAGICELEVLKDTENRGTWRIFMKVKALNGTAYEYDGCIFNRPEKKSDFVIQALENELLTVKSLTYMPNRTISCPNAPYPLTRCYLRLADNTIISPPRDLFRRTSKLGICLFPNVELKKGDLICSFNSLDPTEADLQQEYVVEENEFIKASTPIIRDFPLKHTRELELHCKMSIESELTNCLFVSPKGALYHLPSSSFTSKSHSYRGQGLLIGDCGVVINLEDGAGCLGEWSCHIEANLFRSDKRIEVSPEHLTIQEW